MSNNFSDARNHSVFEVRTAADASAVPVLRNIAADLAIRQDLDLDAVDDLRMAVDEACGLLIPLATRGGLDCTFEVQEKHLSVTVTVATDKPHELPKDTLGWQLLAALATRAHHMVTPAESGYFSKIEIIREYETVSQ